MKILNQLIPAKNISTVVELTTFFWIVILLMALLGVELDNLFPKLFAVDKPRGQKIKTRPRNKIWEKILICFEKDFFFKKLMETELISSPKA